MVRIKPAGSVPPPKACNRELHQHPSASLSINGGKHIAEPAFAPKLLSPSLTSIPALPYSAATSKLRSRPRFLGVLASEPTLNRIRPLFHGKLRSTRNRTTSLVDVRDPTGGEYPLTLHHKCYTAYDLKRTRGSRLYRTSCHVATCRTLCSKAFTSTYPS